MDPYIGQIMMVGFNYAPKGWALCKGQTLPISQNQALFSLLGTSYGGDGRTSFGLPDLRGRVPVHQGQGQGRTYTMGQQGGREEETMSVNQMPAHSHNGNLNLQASASSTLKASTGFGGGVQDPGGNSLANTEPIYRDDDAGTALRNGTIETTVSDNGSSVTIGQTGGSQPTSKMQPYMTVNFIIALQGVYPPRS